MHVILGSLIVIGTFLLSLRFMTNEFSGFINYYSMILLFGVPVGLMIVTYRFSTLWMALRGLLRAVTRNANRERERMAQNLLAFGREIRQEKAAQAASILERESDPVFRYLGRHVIQRSEPGEIETDALILGRRELDVFRQGEKVLSSLGDFAPAMGMIGTVIGLIHLLANMRDFDKLGPGMAIALLTTFYGLLLAHLIYLPLARLVADQGQQRAENLNLVVEGMLKLARRRPMHEVQEVVGLKSASSR